MKEHAEHRIYDECEHDHLPGEPGVIEVQEVGLVCEEGYMYSVCFDCHTHDGECHEETPEEQAWPCDARVAMDRVKELERVLCEIHKDPPRKTWVEAESRLAAVQALAWAALAGKVGSDG